MWSTSFKRIVVFVHSHTEQRALLHTVTFEKRFFFARRMIVAAYIYNIRSQIAGEHSVNVRL